MRGLRKVEKYNFKFKFFPRLCFHFQGNWINFPLQRTRNLPVEIKSKTIIYLEGVIFIQKPIYSCR